MLSSQTHDNKEVLAYLIGAPSQATTGAVLKNAPKKTGSQRGPSTSDFDGRNNCATAWQGKIDRSTLKRSYSFASCLAIADDARLTGDYKDVHCWAFTPASFARICAELAQNELLNFECAEFHDTAFNEFEFFVTMRRSGDSEQNARSWRNVEASARELPFPTGQSADA